MGGGGGVGAGGGGEAGADEGVGGGAAVEVAWAAAVAGEAGYPQAAACLQEAEEANKVKNAGYELAIKGALLRFLSILIGQHGTSLPADTTDTRRLKTVLS